MRLDEALKIKSIDYSGTRAHYNIHDKNPHLIILDPKYKDDSYLAFNTNYLDSLSKKEKAAFEKKINEFDNKILGVKGFKSWLKSQFNIGEYKLSKDKKIERYKKIVSKFPELKKIIRRYKYSGMKKEKE